MLLPTSGGSLPLSIITERLKTVTISVPIANYDNNQHAENENIRLQNLWDGIETWAAIMTEMSHQKDGSTKVDTSNLNLPILLLLAPIARLRKSVFAAQWLSARCRSGRRFGRACSMSAEFALPHDDYGQEIKDRFPEWRDAIIQADGLVIVTPEYNHGYPGALKAVLDLLLREYVHKSVAFVGVSAGPWGGTRVIEAMVPMVRELGLAVTFTDLNFPYVQRDV